MVHDRPDTGRGAYDRFEEESAELSEKMAAPPVLGKAATEDRTGMMKRTPERENQVSLSDRYRAASGADGGGQKSARRCHCSQGSLQPPLPSSGFRSRTARRGFGRERSAAYSTPELDFIHGVLERGLLLENEHFPLAEKIIALFLDRSGFRSRDLLILNGIPRHEGQAVDIRKIANIHALIVLDCSAEEVRCRIRDNVGGDRTERVDDDIALIGKKLNIYRERTAPLIRHYEEQGSTVYRLGVTGTMKPGDAYQNVSALAAAHPPVALVAEPPER